MKRKRVHIYIGVVLFFLSSNLNGQSNWPEWESGKIYLSSGKVLEGDIIYEEGVEVVQLLDENGSVKSYGAFLIDSFQIDRKKYSKKYSRYYWNRGYENYKNTPDFFINIYNGKLKLLSKERKILVSDNLGSSSMTFSPGLGYFPVYFEQTVFNYYYYDENGQIEYIKDFKKFFIDRYPQYKKDIKKAFQKVSSERQKYIEVIKFLESKLKI